MRKGNFISWVVFFFVTVAVFRWFSDEAGQTETPSGVRSDQAAYAGLTPAWPPLADTDQSSAVEGSTNLFDRNIYLVLDGSGSMDNDDCAGGSTKMDVAKKAVTEFVQGLPGSVSLGLVVFDSNGLSERVALATSDHGAFLDKVHAVVPGGETPLRNAVGLAYDRLLEQANAQLGYGEYQIVVITDGAATSNQDPRAIVNEINRVSPVVINTIGFCIGVNHALNQPGRTLYTAADDYHSLRQGLDSVLAESPDFKVLSFN